jgi:nucleotide-binding universal stress UspA family protein
MFTKILAATARPLVCDEVVLSASQIAQNNNAKLHILHVLESDSSIYRNYVKHFRTGEEIVCNQAYQEEVKKELYTNCTGALGPSDDFAIRVTTGFPWEEILRWVRKENIDLIVLGPHTRKADGNDVQRVSGTVGSTADGVIRRERCPVMIVGRSIPKRKSPFENVMVSIDFSPSCICALRFALNLAQKKGSKLFLFHMLPVSPQPEYNQTRYDADIREAKQKLEELSKEIPETIETEIETWGGAYPDLEIEKFARENAVDLITMGSHTKIEGKIGDSGWYVGSAVERVSSKSICPVIVITDPKVLEKWEN